ncbi:MAG: type II toxin-antitoxin system RelE/ParE family toxin [Anaerolineae bacterium]|nr:type II toxin-antitoxin system RelE/ParE family toxin [Anaerolineae bacterium]
MAYKVIVPKPVYKDVQRLPAQIRRRIWAEIDMLKEDPRPMGYIKLRGQENQYRIRVGDYRIVYEIHDDVLVVYLIKVGHRKDIYD